MPSSAARYGRKYLARTETELLECVLGYFSGCWPWVSGVMKKRTERYGLLSQPSSVMTSYWPERTRFLVMICDTPTLKLFDSMVSKNVGSFCLMPSILTLRNTSFEPFLKPNDTVVRSPNMSWLTPAYSVLAL